MARRSLQERFDELQHRGEQLAPSVLHPTTITHERAAEVLVEMIHAANTLAGEMGGAQRALLRTVTAARGMLLDGLSKVPEAEVVAFMTGLRDRIQSIIDANPDGAVSSDEHPGAGGSAEPVANLATGT